MAGPSSSACSSADHFSEVSMNILILSCSSHPNGNTEQLARAYERGCREAGHQTRLLCAHQTKVSPCLGCNYCTEHGVCVQKDGMQAIYKAFHWCDRIVFATPVYFWNISGQMKLIIDRLYATGVPSDKGYFAYPVKRCALLATSADTEKHFWVFESVRQYFERLTDYLRWERDGMLFAGNCGGTKMPRRIEETDWLKKAYELGKK